MFIKKINDSDGDGFCYDVTVSDGNHEILCFSDKKLNNGSEFTLYSLEPTDIKKSMQKTYILEHLGKYFVYHIVGKILDLNSGLMRVYGIEFEFGGLLPPDVREGDYIDFINVRMDCNPIA